MGISLTVFASIATGQTQLPAGSLDNSFGREGKVSLRSGYDSKLSSVAIQPDGKIVAAGYVYDRRAFFAVVRFTSDGALDASFNKTGMVITRFDMEPYSASAIVIQPDGKIVVTSALSVFQSGQPRSRDFVVLRLNSDGSSDSGFGVNGEVITNFSGANDLSAALALQPDGKIIVGGSTVEGLTTSSRLDLELARYNPDGSLDKTFNSTGMVVTPNSRGLDSFRGMALQADGKIVVAGNIYTTKDPDSTLIRYNSDGSIDQSFGVEGRVISDFGDYDFVKTLLIQSDGKILVTGYQRNNYFAYDGASLFLARFNPDGSPDQGFGNKGKVIGNFDKFTEAYSAVVQSDGKILLAGSCGPGDPNYSYSLLDFLAVRYNADGTLDKDFGDNGKVLTDFGRLERARAAAVDAKGNIILAGYSGDYTRDGFEQADFALVRLIGVTPKPLPDFGLSTESTTIIASRSSKVKLTITINRLNGFDAKVTINAPDTSNLKIVIPEPMVTATGASANFTLKIKKGTPAGNHQLVFTGKDDAGHERSITITLAIQ